MTHLGRYSPENLIRSKNLASTPGNIIALPSRLDNSVEKEHWLQDLCNPEIPKVLDLFCGAGGFSEGFVNTGFTVVAGIDHTPAALNTFAANIAARTFLTDISEIEDPQTIVEGLKIGGIDVIIGGPPCQGFSQVGQARIRSLDEDEQLKLLARNELYSQFFRFVEIFHPSFFVMENVPNLLTFENKAYIQAIQKESERLGYSIDFRILDASDYGVPQVRRRLIVVGSLNGRLFYWPRTINEKDKVSLTDAIGDLPAVKPPQLEECLEYAPVSKLTSYQQLMRCRVPLAEKQFIRDHVVRPVREDDIVIFSNMKPGDRYTDIDPRYQRYNAESFKDKYYMLKPDAPGVTITAHLDKDGYRYIHWDSSQHRTISVREAARIQSFGDHFRFAGGRSARFRQIGNAVPPIMAEKIAEQIKRAIKRNSGLLLGDVMQLALPGHEDKRWLVVADEEPVH